MRFAHTNLVARDWRRLVRFYESVFGCVLVPPERDLGGEWLDRGTGVRGAELTGAHLRLPGHGPSGPTLEVFQWAAALERPEPAPNRIGLGHLAFEVDDPAATVAAVVRAGGATLGEATSHDVPGVGRLTFAYARDPEGNVLEIQRWEPAPLDELDASAARPRQ